MSKPFAWVLLISSVICFFVQLTTQQVLVAADRLHTQCLRSPPPTQPDWPDDNALAEVEY